MLNDFKSFIKITKKCWSEATPKDKRKEIILIIIYILYNTFLFLLPLDMYDKIVSSHNLLSLIIIGPSIFLLMLIFGNLGIWNTKTKTSREELECTLFSSWLFFMIAFTTIMIPNFKKDLKFNLLVLVIALIFITIIIELIFLLIRKARKQYEAKENLTLPTTTELTDAEKELVQKLYTTTKLTMPTLVAMFLFSLTAVLILLLPITFDFPIPPWEIACIFILLPIFVYGFLLGKYTMRMITGSKSPEWTTILLKLSNKKSDRQLEEAIDKSQKVGLGGITATILGKYAENSGLKGAAAMGEAIGGAMVIHSADSMAKAVRTHVEEVADLADIKLNKSAKSSIIKIIVIPFIIFVISAIAVFMNSEKLNNKIEKLKEKPIDIVEQTMQKSFNGDVSVSIYNKKGGQITAYLHEERKAILEVDIDKETEEITNLNYNIYIEYTDKKEVALARINTEIAELNSALTNVETDDFIKNVYLPNDQFKTDFLADKDYKNLNNSKNGSFGYQLAENEKYKAYCQLIDIGNKMVFNLTVTEK